MISFVTSSTLRPVVTMRCSVRPASAGSAERGRISVTEVGFQLSYEAVDVPAMPPE